jgi:hypothetical protein
MWNSCKYIKEATADNQRGVILRLKKVLLWNITRGQMICIGIFKEDSVFSDLTSEFRVNYRPIARNIGAPVAAVLWDEGGGTRCNQRPIITHIRPTTLLLSDWTKFAAHSIENSQV